MSDGVVMAPSTQHRQLLDRAVGHVLGNTAITGVLGSLFWLLAPRVADNGAVAASVSAASLVIVLGFVGQLNMATALSRFLPQAGTSQRSALRSAYAIAVGFSLLLSVGVIAVGLARGGELVRGGDMRLTFAVALALPLWTLFALQDGALVALRQASVLPIENGITSIVRIALLPVASLAAWSSGLLAIWLLPIVPAIVIVNRLLFSRLLSPGRDRFHRRREAVRFAITDLPGVLLTVASLRLVPVVVVEAEGSEAGAHIGVAWSILAVSALALPALSRLALSEMSHDPGAAPQVLDHLRRTVMMVVTPLALLAAVGAPLILRVAGPDYADGGALVLAVGALGLIPAALMELRLADLRVDGRVSTVMALQVGRAAALLVGTFALAIGGMSLAVGAVFTIVNTVALGVTALVASPRLSSSVGRGALIAFRLAPGICGVMLVASAIPRVDPDRIDDAGLISALPTMWFVGAALIVLGIFTCLEEAGAWRAAAFAHLVALVVVLHGLPGMVDEHPRFPVAWLHAGFIDEIATSGELFPRIDGRFSWAGFFSGGALLQELSGQPDVLWLVRFTPIALNLAAVLAILVLGPLVGATRRQAFVAGLLYVVANWIGQDYFAPQATTFILYLAVVALVLRYFGTDPAVNLSPRWMRIIRPERPPVVSVDDRQRLAAWTISLLVAVGLMMSHQLSPMFLGLALLALAATRCVSVRGLPFIVLGLFLAWLSFSAEAYWVGHLDNIVGSVGQVTSLVQSNVAERAAAPSAERQLVVRSRMLLPITLWVIALFSAIRLRRQWRTPLPLVCLLVAPFPPLAVQPYGGEMIMRVTLFALPATALLCARLLAPEGLFTRRRRIALAVVFTAMIPVFVLTRFGNEKFERVPPADAVLARELYASVPDGSTVFVRNRQTLVQADRVDQVRFRQLPRVELDQVIDEMEKFGDAVFLMFTEGQAAFGQVTRGYPDGWLQEIEAEFVSTGRFVEVARHGDAVLLRLIPPVDGTVSARSAGGGGSDADGSTAAAKDTRGGGSE